MRSVTQFAQVEGHSSLVRDMSSHAIIATDDVAYSAYKARRESEKKRQALIDKQVEEIESLKHDMMEIKHMLSQILSVKGH